MTDLPIPAAALDDCGAVLGRRGSGKSNTLQVLFEHELRAGHRSVMVDPKGDRWGIRFNPDGSPSEFQIPIFGGERGDVPIDEHQGEQLARFVVESRSSCLIDLSGMLLGQQQRFMLDFSRHLYHLNREPLSLFLEEIDQFANQDQRYQPPKLVHHVSNLASLGRQRGFIVWIASQRAAKVNKNLLNMTDSMIAMGARAPLDRKAIADWFAGHSPEAAKVVEAELGKLQAGEAYAWVGGVDYFERVTFPLASTFDSGRRPKHGERTVEVQHSRLDVEALKAALEQFGMEPEADAETAAADPELAQKLKAAETLAAQRDAELRQIREKMTATLALVAEYFHDWNVNIERAVQGIRELSDRLKDAGNSIASAQVLRNMSGKNRLSESTGAPIPPAPVEAPAGVDTAPAPTIEGVPERQMRLLRTLRFIHRVIRNPTPRRTVLAFFAKVSPKSSGFEKNLSSLRTAGWINYPTKGEVELTAEAWKHLPEEEDAREITIEAALNALPPRLREVLDPLIHLDADGVTRATLAERIGKSDASSGFEKNLSTLRTMGLVDYPAKGRVCAVDWLRGAAAL